MARIERGFSPINMPKEEPVHRKETEKKLYALPDLPALGKTSHRVDLSKVSQAVFGYLPKTERTKRLSEELLTTVILKGISDGKA